MPLFLTGPSAGFYVQRVRLVRGPALEDGQAPVLCVLAVRFSPRDTVETTDGAIDVERARERPVLVEDAPGTRELR